MEKLISVIVPTWKRPALLINCLNALRQQSLPASLYEVIVVTDGPDAVTAKAVKLWCRNHAFHITCLSLCSKQGPAAARNLGWRNAKSELIAFTDDDCLPDRDWLKNILDTYNDEKLIAFSGRVIVPVSSSPTDHELNTFNLESAEFITANCAATRGALEMTEGFDEQFKLAWREDSDLEFKLLLKHIPIRKVREAIVVHPARKARWGVSIKEQKKGMFNVLLYKKFPQLYKSKIHASPPLLYYIMAACSLLMISGMVAGSTALASGAGFIWVLLIIYFTSKRLSVTSHTPEHIAEMVFTSIVIPFYSIYWHLYGLVKFKAAFV